MLSKTFTILLLASCLTAPGQSPQAFTSIEAYKTLPGVRLITSLDTSLLSPHPEIRFGSFTRHRMELHPDGKYKLLRRDCTTLTTLDSGTWNIAFERMVEIQSRIFGKKLYDVLEYGRFIILVESVERRKFVDLFRDLQANDTGPFIFNDILYTKEDIITMGLGIYHFVIERRPRSQLTF
ncbi:MAG TPA: hypothetical protein VD993_06970 [Chitinophagaceae bacterium]|nr:hypothetical protein [Chitinophagaceae bacterium]